MSAPPRQIIPLTSFRFVAAMLVVFYHTDAALKTHLADTMPRWDLSEIGYVGVGLFFTLSGYILAIVYDITRGRAAIMRFWVARFARIYPIYVLSLLADLPRLMMWRISKYGLGIGISHSLGTLAAQMLMLQAWNLNWSGLNFPSWSLSNETFYYLLYPAIAFVLLKNPNAKRAIFILLGCWLLSQTGPLIWARQLHAGSPIGLDVLKVNPLLSLPEFVGGMTLASLQKDLQQRLDSSRLQPIASLCGLLALALFVAVALFHPYIPLIVIHNGLLLPVFCLVIFWLSNGQDMVIRFLSQRLPQLLGEASYTIYLIHAPVWYGLTALITVDNAATYLLYISILLGLGMFLYTFVEAPSRKWILQCYDRRFMAVSINI